eukprot:Skav230281  [mRNA]  locus=scaffold2091:138359:139931:+ [translate_table: standard]
MVAVLPGARGEGDLVEVRELEDGEYQLLSHEEQRRTVVRGAPCASTAELKQFLLRLQDIASSPSLRTLSLTESRARSERSEHSEPPMGGANIRRLQALSEG